MGGLILNVAVALACFSFGAAAGAFLIWKWAVIEIQRERMRADNAMDALARSVRGEPISVSAMVRDEKVAQRFEEELRQFGVGELLGGDETEEDDAQ